MKLYDYIRQNVLSVDPREFESFYNAVRDADIIIPIGAGRTRAALDISFGEMALTGKKDILALDDVGFPGHSITDGIENLKRRGYNNILVVCASGSGRSPTPVSIAEEVSDYIRSGKNGVHLVTITSNPDSPLVKNAEKPILLRIRGREPWEKPTVVAHYRSGGILGDKFELALLAITHFIGEGIYKEATASQVMEFAREGLESVIHAINKFVDSEDYEFLISRMEQRNHIILGGLGSSARVVNMTFIRLMHIKEAVGDHGVFKLKDAPRPRAGDLLIMVSSSGRRPILLNWAENYRKAGAIVVSFIGRENSPLSKLSHRTIVLDQVSDDPRRPSRFYLTAAFVLSPLLIDLVGRYESRGLQLPEGIFRWYHSVTN